MYESASIAMEHQQRHLDDAVVVLGEDCFDEEEAGRIRDLPGMQN